MTRLALVGSGFVLALGCSPLPLPPFELDVSSNCNEVVVESVWSDLDAKGGDIWSRVITAVADAPGSEGVWLLVVADAGGEEVLTVVHLGPDGIVVVEELELDVAFADDLSFIAGPTRGQAWLVQRSPELFQLRRYEAEPVPVRVAVSADFIGPPPSGFPDLQCIDENGFVIRCMTEDWPRELVFFEGSPYLLSLPPSSGDSSVDLIVGALSPDLSYVDQPQTLNFAPDCDQDLPPEDLAACEALKSAMVHPSLSILGIQPDTRQSTTSLALYRETLTIAEGYPEIPQADVAFVVLGHDKLGHPAGNLVSEPTLYPPASGDDSEVVVDSRAMYVRYDGGVSPVIVQKSTLDDEFDTLTDELEFEEDFTLLQLDEDLALGRISVGVWQLVKLFPDAPGESRLTVHDPGSELERVVFAGPGSFLLHEAEGGPDLVRVRCNDEPPEAE